MLKKALIILSFLALILGLIFAFFGYPMLSIGTGYAAKKMCSCTFISGRSQESIQKDDLDRIPLNYTETVINQEEKSATSTLFGMSPSTAVYRENLGCVLVHGKDDYQINLDLPTIKMTPDSIWPKGDAISKREMEGVDYQNLDEAILGAFDSSMEMDSIRTRAVVVIYKDSLIAEKYAKGIDKDTEILGWSMTKSIVNALIGMLVKEGKMNLDDKALFEHWTDERKDITLKDMLQMQSGLAFEENYAVVSDATEMLFKSEDVVERASRNKLQFPIGSQWYYSSGTTNMLAGLVRKQFDNHQDYLEFPHNQLFRKIGMNSAVMEIDESGNYIGSSYCYATPRDWAKFGLLYLHQGNWYGEQIVDSSWVEFSRQPAEHSAGIYGGQFWLNVDHSAYEDVPDDLFSCNGFEGQYVYIIPSKDLVVVRMGLGKAGYDANAFLKGVIEAVGE